MQDADKIINLPKLKYLSGLHNIFETESLDNALPKSQNSPQHCPYGLYAEQINGSAFTAPRHTNLHTWLYKILPSAVHSEYNIKLPEFFLKI